MKKNVVGILVALGLTAGTAAAQNSPLPLRASGFVEGAYAWSNRAVDRQIVGNLYLARMDELLLNAAEVKLERPVPEKGSGSGFVVEAIAGNHAELIRAAGLDLGPHADLVQAYGVWNFPDASLQITAGKMATILGNEVIESVSNPNLSVGSQYVFVENFTDTGVDLAWTGRSGWSARGRFANGWDVVADNNRSKTVFAKLGWNAGARSVAVFGYTGRELPDSIGGNRSGVELLAAAPIGSISATLQLDAGREEALDAGWRAAGLWLVCPIRSGVTLALRSDVLDDHDGARTSGALGFPAHGGQTLVSGTTTLDMKVVPGTVVRPEVRYDRSTLAVFGGEREQWTLALGAGVQF